MRKIRVFLAGILAAFSLMMLAACSFSGGKSSNSDNTVITAPGTGAAAPADSAGSPTDNSEAVTAQTDDGTPLGPTLEDQKQFKENIETFATFIESTDFKSAEQFCTEDFKDYLESLATGTGAITDHFSLAIIEGYPLTFVSARGFYETGSSVPDYNLMPDKPTVNFDVTFEYKDSSGKIQTAGGYVMGVKSDGGYLIGGFASSL